MRKAAVQKGVRVAIVGATSLRGRELKELLEASGWPVAKLSLLDDEEALGGLTEYAGEPTIVQTIDPETFQPGDVVFFASTTPDFGRRYGRSAVEAGARVVDLSHAVLDEPDAVVRAAWLKSERAAGAARPMVVAAHPAVLGLLALLGPLKETFGLARAVAHVFLPVSERGTSAMDELHQQTVDLLSFREIPRAVFDAQVAFNLLAAYGVRSHLQLADVERIVARELERCQPELAARTSVRLLQVPVFHGIGFSLWVELRQPADPVAVEAALETPWVGRAGAASPVPALTEATGRDEILVGPAISDPVFPSAIWLWAVADNLRLAARNALELARELAG